MPRIGISGHRGLPQRTQQLIAAALRKELEPHAGTDLVGLSCLAGGPDQLFARTVLDLGETLEVVARLSQVVRSPSQHQARLRAGRPRPVA